MKCLSSIDDSNVEFHIFKFQPTFQPPTPRRNHLINKRLYSIDLRIDRCLKEFKMKTVASRADLMASFRPTSTLLNIFGLLCRSSIGPQNASKLQFKVGDVFRLRRPLTARYQNIS